MAMAASVIRTGEALSNVVGRIIESGIKSKLHRSGLAEKENQDATSQGLALTPSSGAGSDQSGGSAGSKGVDDSGPSKTFALDADDVQLKTGEVTVDSIVAKLNAIRSGRSFREDAVKHNMDEYVQSLKTAERTALLAFLKGIAQIVTGEVSGQQAVDPKDPDPNVKMKKHGVDDDSTASESGQQTKHVKPNVLTSKSGSGKQQAPSKEDTTAPVSLPIKPRHK